MEDITIKDGMMEGMGTSKPSLAMASETPEEDGDIDMYVEFGKPYVFDDETYNGIDMSCLDNISTRDMMDIEKRFYKFGIISMNPENTIAYAKVVAQKASGLPIEFFDDLPVKDMMKIKSRVVHFFYS